MGINLSTTLLRADVLCALAQETLQKFLFIADQI